MSELSAHMSKALEGRDEIRLAYLFGSFARGTAHDRSDVDIAVLARPPLGLDETEALTRALAEATGRSVDLVDLEQAPPLLLREVIAGGQVVFCRSETEQAEFELRAIARYLDTRHVRDLQRRYLQQRVGERFGPNPEIVRRKLATVEQTVDRLQDWMPLTSDLLARDIRLQWAVERGLQIAAEAVFDTGSHVLAGQFREIIDEYAQIPPRLAARGVIAPETAQRLTGLAGFRNVLVHDYADVDLGKVVEALERLHDLEAFALEVAAWLERQAP
jgi:uncharacterized protein YutE (UPF0331/DUF86 family)/predicted nucleotidyltransferase